MAELLRLIQQRGQARMPFVPICPDPYLLCETFYAGELRELLLQCSDVVYKVKYHFYCAMLTQSAVMRLHVDCPSVRDVDVCFSHRLEFFENNFMAEYLKAHALVDTKHG